MENSRKRFGVVFVGPAGSGKTSLLITYLSNTFPDSYCPRVHDIYTFSFDWIPEKPVFQLSDTASGSDYDRLRPLSYKDASLFVLCYDVCDEKSLQLLKEKYVPEVAHFKGNNSKWMVLGCKMDTRECNPKRCRESVMTFLLIGKHRTMLLYDVVRMIGKMIWKTKWDPCWVAGLQVYDEGKAMALQMNAQHMTCSALTRQGVSHVFDEATKLCYVDELYGRKQKQKGWCVVM